MKNITDIENTHPDSIKVNGRWYDAYDLVELYYTIRRSPIDILNLLIGKTTYFFNNGKEYTLDQIADIYRYLESNVEEPINYNLWVTQVTGGNVQ